MFGIFPVYKTMVFYSTILLEILMCNTELSSKSSLNIERKKHTHTKKKHNCVKAILIGLVLSKCWNWN